MQSDISMKIIKYPENHKKYNSSDLEKSDYITLKLRSDGDSEINISWRYSDAASFVESRDIINRVLTYLTENINKVDSTAFIRYKSIPFPAEIKYSFFRILFDFDGIKIENYREFEIFLLTEYPCFLSTMNIIKILDFLISLSIANPSF